MVLTPQPLAHAILRVTYRVSVHCSVQPGRGFEPKRAYFPVLLYALVFRVLVPQEGTCVVKVQQFGDFTASQPDDLIVRRGKRRIRGVLLIVAIR